MFKQIIKGKSGYFCDICGKELNIDDKISLIIKRFWSDKNMELCRKHGIKVWEYIQTIKTEKD